MIKKYFLFTFLLLSFVSFAQTTLSPGDYFAPIDEKYLELTAVCRKNYDEKERKEVF